jgi:hypothetical protein
MANESLMELIREQKELKSQRDKYKLALERISKMRRMGLDSVCDIADEVLHPGMVDRSVDRTHEECCDCRLEAVSPPRCPGHRDGPVHCPDFVPVVPAAKEKKNKRQQKRKA